MHVVYKLLTRYEEAVTPRTYKSLIFALRPTMRNIERVGRREEGRNADFIDKTRNAPYRDIALVTRHRRR